MAFDPLIIKITAREMVRHFVGMIGANRLLDLVREARGLQTDYLTLTDEARRFESIYSTGVWSRHSPGGEVASGSGSSLEATRSLRREFAETLHRIECKSLLDVGCGDLNWLSGLELGEIDYVGVDVVHSVIVKNQQLYAAPNRRFICMDALAAELPTADVVLCREILFHLSFDDIWKLLRNVMRNKPRYLMATTDAITLFNSDIRSGDFRMLNLSARPFVFPEPELFIADDDAIPRRRIGIWSSAEIERYI